MIRLIVIGIVGAFSYLFGSFFNEEQPQPEREKVIQSTVLNILNQAHFDPKVLNDEFSKEAFNVFLEYIDGRKRFFTQEDIMLLKVYELQIDDQATQGSLEFFDLAISLLEKRIDQCETLYQEILSHPMDFTIHEQFEFDPEKKTYPKDNNDLKETWRKMLKFEVMEGIESRTNRQLEQKDVKKLSDEEIEKEARNDVKQTFEEWYKNFRKVNRNDRFEAYLNTFTHIFDPHTDYYNPKEKQDFDISMSGKIEGIGARLRTDGDLTQIVSIVPGGPAWKNKEIEVNDHIVKVTQKDKEPVDIFGMRIDDVVQMIRGEKGSFVILTIKKKDGTIKDIEIERDIVITEESIARSVILNLEGGIENIGYIHLPKFYSDFEGGPEGTSCAVDVAKEIEKLKANNVNGIILDLRSNGGGSLRDVVDMSGLFIKDGPIVQVKPRDRKAYVYKDEDPTVQYSGPLIVLINSFSASASEILAAAMQDYGRAIIVGSQSFGKGSVQRFIDLDQALRGNNEFKPLGQVKITMQKFYRIDGGSTQLKGVVPDITLPDRYDKIDVGEREYPHAMGWSEIAGLQYNQEVYKTDKIDYLTNRSQARIEQNNQFALIKDQANWFKSSRDETSYSLNIETYRDLLKSRKEKSEKFDAIMSSDIPSLIVKNLEQDKQKINFDPTTIARNESWIGAIKKDIYLEESLQIMKDLIEGTAITNRKELKD